MSVRSEYFLILLFLKLVSRRESCAAARLSLRRKTIALLHTQSIFVVYSGNYSARRRTKLHTMKQEFFACAWGLVDAAGGPYPLSELPAIVRKLKSLGYAGIEIPAAFVMRFGVPEFKALLEAEAMLCITQVFSSGAPPTPGNMGLVSSAGIAHPADASFRGTRDVKGHCAVWDGQVRESVRLGASLRSINSHTGKDYFSEAEYDELFAFCVALEKEVGVPVNHETHRARVLYTPWVVPRVLAAHPDVRFTADLSHFSVVTETGAADPEVCAVVAAMTPRIRHVHARVGFEEGPQVPDPRAPKWAAYLDGYVTWCASRTRDRAVTRVSRVKSRVLTPAPSGVSVATRRVGRLPRSRGPRRRDAHDHARVRTEGLRVAARLHGGNAEQHLGNQSFHRAATRGSLGRSRRQRRCRPRP
jgi:sugar phosphate isomerase/epimerase